MDFLSLQMGHAGVEITLNRYSHLLQDSHPAQAARLSDLVFARPRGFPKPRLSERAKGAGHESVSAKILLTEQAGISRKTAKQDVRRSVNEASQPPVIVA